MGDKKGGGRGDGGYSFYGAGPGGNSRGNGVATDDTDGTALIYERDVTLFYQSWEKVLYGDGSVD